MEKCESYQLYLADVRLGKDISTEILYAIGIILICFIQLFIPIITDLIHLLPFFSGISLMASPIMIIYFPLILFFEIIVYFITVLKWDEMGAIYFLSINGLLFFGYFFFLVAFPIYLVGLPIIIVGSLLMKLIISIFAGIISVGLILYDFFRFFIWLTVEYRTFMPSDTDT